jgi:HD-GYP domain-containing protein (c-di-GMP phosphodiesterase class II)
VDKKDGNNGSFATDISKIVGEDFTSVAPDSQKEKGPSAQEKRFQEIGLKIVGNFFMIIRSLRTYDVQNKIFVKPLHELERLINTVISKDKAINIYGADSTLYMNETLLRFDRASLDNVNYLLEQFERHGISGFSSQKPVTVGQLQQFLMTFANEPSKDNKPKSVGGIRPQLTAAVRQKLKNFESKQEQEALEMKADRKRYALLLYCRLLHYVRQFHNKKEPDPSPRKANRILQELIDLVRDHPVQFLGFSNEVKEADYEPYHVTNTAMLSIVFGDFLGLTRPQLLDVGHLALIHNVGKRYLPRTVLRKRDPLDKQEIQLIERIPLLTIRTVIDGEFAWNKINDAIRVMGVRGEANTSGEGLESAGTPLLSRIVALCATFDALCTRRPFRPKFHPSQALVMMRDNLREQFDPYLLERFVALFRPMVVKSVGWRGGAAPPERRQIKTKVNPIQMVRNELLEYRELSTVKKPTLEQEHRLQFLKRFLKWKLEGN